MIHFRKTGHGECAAGHLGSVVDVIAANLPHDLTSRRFEAGDFAAGFELASPKGIESVGEAVVINGYCFATSTDPKSGDYNKTIVGKDFVAGGLFVLPHEAKASHQIEVKDESFSMLDFYGKIYLRVGRPLVFSGLFHFSHFHGTAIGKAPIDGRNIFQHKEEYYPHSEIHREDVWAYVIGGVTDFRGFAKLNQELEVVLYKNPMDQESQLTHHAHCLLLRKKVGSPKEIGPATVAETLHLLAGTTILSSCQTDIYTLSSVENYASKGLIR